MPKVILSVCLLTFYVVVISGQTQTWLRADGTSDTYTLVNSVFGKSGASEMPDCGHPVKHVTQGHDETLGRPVFFFHSHVNQDDDRCGKQDRQRTEIRPDPDLGLTGVSGERLSFSWNFRLDPEFQASNAWTHLHQLKAVGGDDSMPIITLQARRDPDILVVSHIDSNIRETIIGQANLSEFRGVWVHAQQTVVVGYEGSYNLTLSRIKGQGNDNMTLMTVSKPRIDMWRHNTTYVRSKYGIYRSLVDRTTLRDEVVRFDSFCISKNTDSQNDCP